ncbi:MAG: hypothetical protein AB1625_15150 [Acidobacteriota bacterium]
MSLDAFSKEFDSALMDYFWAQWAELGVSGFQHRQEHRAQDPEALLLATLEWCRADTRLFVEVADWLALNAGLLSLQRVKNLLAADPDVPRAAVVHVLAALGESVPGFRWSLSVHPSSRRKPEVAQANGRVRPKPLVIELSAPVTAFNSLRLSKKSRQPVPSGPIAFAFRMRAVLGVTARAEATRVLLLHSNPELDTAAVAQAIAFAKRNVAEALEPMVSVGLVRRRTSGRVSTWSIDRSRWFTFLGVACDQVPTWVDWVSLFRGVFHVGRWLRREDWVHLPDQVQASRAREVLATAAPWLAAAVPGWTPPDPREHLARIIHWGGVESRV